MKPIDEENNVPEPILPEADELAKLEEKLSAAELQRDEYLGGWQRSKADFINYKKEEMKQMENITRYGNESILKEFLSIVLNFDLALKTIEKGNDDSNDKGLVLIRGQMQDLLKKRGVEKIEISPGDPFDPSIAEAMLEVDSDHAPGTIAEIMEPGYRLYDKVIRAAKVSVSKDHG